MRTWLALPLVCLWSLTGVAAQPMPERPSDDLLTRPALQAVVEAQVDRNGPLLRKKIGADDADVRARAALALASVRDTSAISGLLDLLSDGVPLVRTDAAFALGQMPSGVPASPLLRALGRERDPSVQNRLIEALGTTGNPESLRDLLRLRLPPARRSDVALTIARYGMRGVTDSTATTWLLERLRADDPWTRRNAAYALGRVEALAAGRADTLRAVLNDVSPNDPAAMHLLRALGTAGDSSDAARLGDWLRTAPDWRTRTEAARALSSLSSLDGSGGALVGALNDGHPLVARTAAETLAGLEWSPDRLAAVGAWLDAHPDRWRVTAPLLRGLARNGRPERVLDAVDRWRTERSPVAYAAALPALAPLDAPRADSLLDTALRHDDVRVAAAGVQAVVGRWERTRPGGADVTFRRLTAAVRRGDPALLYHGASALADSAFAPLGTADTLAATYRTLTTPNALEGMTAVLGALGTLGGSTAEPVLRDALDHPHHALRQAAAQGLSEATDAMVAAAPKPLPETPSIDWNDLQELGPHPRLVLETTRGTVTIELDAEQAPQTVQAITRFARDGRYDGVPFHRVVPNFVVQGGDFARRDGFGGPGRFLRTEATRIGHRRGTIGMASAGRDTEGSQFFVSHSMQPHLDGGYTAFGRVTDGMDVVDQLRVDDRITSAQVTATRER
ncbi:peptidylprolyl isomerase [Salinibacter altiplanensis]|uniref:peptidylprolyl isomerase n=2 Tax=Salinibacter altiplanensis TaxID=1803181 RepID=UPI001F2385C8|nr:peptidylprolyl isomerase [Salinibacter altiplanensis]